MRVIANFMLRTSWSVHCIAEDARTQVSGWITVADEAILLRVFAYVGASDDELAQIRRDIKRWGRGSTGITLAPGRKNLLHIREQYRQGLDLS